MRFSAASLLAFAAAVVAQTSGFDAITSPPSGTSIPAGSTFEIDWEPTTHATDTVSIILLGGASQGTLEILTTIASGITNSVGKFSWNVDSTLGTQATYGLKIQLDSDPTTFQYSFPFAITGGKSTGSSSSSASGSSSTTGGSVSSSSGASTTSAAASASSTVTSISTTAAPVTSSSSTSLATSTKTITTVSVPGNLSTTGAPTKTQTQVVGASSTASGSASVATGAASNVGASSLAFLGGLALAVLAL